MTFGKWVVTILLYLYLSIKTLQSLFLLYFYKVALFLIIKSQGDYF